MGCWGRSGHCVDTGGEGLKREGMGREESRASKSERHICWGLLMEVEQCPRFT